MSPTHAWFGRDQQKRRASRFGAGALDGSANEVRRKTLRASRTKAQSLHSSRNTLLGNRSSRTNDAMNSRAHPRTHSATADRPLAALARCTRPRHRVRSRPHRGSAAGSSTVLRPQRPQMLFGIMKRCLAALDLRQTTSNLLRPRWAHRGRLETGAQRSNELLTLVGGKGECSLEHVSSGRRHHGPAYDVGRGDATEPSCHRRRLRWLHDTYASGSHRPAWPPRRPRVRRGRHKPTTEHFR